MSLFTHSKFYFDYEVDSTHYAFDFNEGGGELNATLSVGSYTLTEFVAELSRAINDAGGQVYTVSVARATRVITISAPGAFSVLIASGSRNGVGIYSKAGFTGVLDLGSATSQVGNTGAGSEYKTQFVLQSHTPSTDIVGAQDGVVNIAADGNTVQVIKFGNRNFMEANFRYVTSRSASDIPSGAPIRQDSNGKSKLQTFMNFLITKAPFEYMADESVPATFEKLYLESTPEDKNGLQHKIKEMIGESLPLFYETGVLTFRKVI